MSYTVPPAGPPARHRPGSVSAAVWLMYLVAASFVGNAIVAVAAHGPMSEVFERAFADDPELNQEGTATAAAVAATGVSLAVAVFFAAALAVLAALVARGSNAAVIITWVAAGVGICCTGWSVISTLARNALTGFGGAGQTDPEELQRLMEELLPSWYLPAGLTLNALQLLGLVAVAILLALPASRAFFRRTPPPPTWEPPVPSYPPVNPPPGG
ncbi:MAG TPA: hypothetical protein VFB84_21290 [Micromonosporaceae bacterium]|nr:hypothetical protein [Micromonosporaceae bacterium]